MTTRIDKYRMLFFHFFFHVRLSWSACSQQACTGKITTMKCKMSIPTPCIAIYVSKYEGSKT